VQIEQLMKILNKISDEMDIQNAQNVFYSVAKNIYPKVLIKADSQDKGAKEWVEHFQTLARHLDLEIPD